MSELPDRVRRAFRDHGSFERTGETTFAATTTAFEGDVAVDALEDGRIRFEVTVRVPTLDAVTTDRVAPVVEEGWYETFELRVVDVSGVTAVERDLDPSVRRLEDEVVVAASLSDVNERRGVDDAGALVDFVEGTYVQGIIPGYQYTEPVASLVSRARRHGTGDAP
jgi:hypothetical protein